MSTEVVDAGISSQQAEDAIRETLAMAFDAWRASAGWTIGEAFQYLFGSYLLLGLGIAVFWVDNILVWWLIIPLGGVGMIYLAAALKSIFGHNIIAGLFVGTISAVYMFGIIKLIQIRIKRLRE